jgi:hypothetical protein
VREGQEYRSSERYFFIVELLTVRGMVGYTGFVVVKSGRKWG